MRLTIDISERAAAAIDKLASTFGGNHNETNAKLDEVLLELGELKGEIAKMANDLSAELAGLNTAVTANTEATAALGPAIDKELQQVLDAINSGTDAAAAVETARANITSVTSALESNAASLQNAVAALGSDDSTT